MPLAVKRTEAPDSGNPKLVELGGRWLEDLGDVAFTLEVHDEDEQIPRPSDVIGESAGDGRMGLASATTEQADDSSPSEPSHTGLMDAQSRETWKDGEHSAVDLAETLYQHVRSLVVDLCAELKEGKAIADALGVTKPTADLWLRRLLEERVLEKLRKPARYVTRGKDLLG